MSKKITQLVETNYMRPNDLFVVVDVQENATKKMTQTSLYNMIASSSSHPPNHDKGTSSPSFYLNSGSIYLYGDDSSISITSDVGGTTLAEFSASNVYMENGEVTQDIIIGGELYASEKHFYIDHPSKPGMKLVYSSLESPYNGIRFTGNSQIENSNDVEVYLPEYINVFGLASEMASVNITPKGSYQNLFVKYVDISHNKVIFGIKLNFITKFISKIRKLKYEFYWDITLERSDVPRPETEVPPHVMKRRKK